MLRGRADAAIEFLDLLVPRLDLREGLGFSQEVSGRGPAIAASDPALVRPRQLQSRLDLSASQLAGAANP